MFLIKQLGSEDKMFNIIYHHLVVSHDIPKLSREWEENISCAVEKKLTTFPDLYSKPLRRALKGYRKLRVGDYRIIFKIEKKTVKIIMIQHRSKVYNESEKRI